MNCDETLNGWLVETSGLMAGRRHLIRDVTRVGRSPDNDIVLDDATTISGYHLEIRRENNTYTVRDLNSTNGTFVNGERIVETTLLTSSSVQLGSAGPALKFVLDDTSAVDPNQTMETNAVLTSTIDDLSMKPQPSISQEEELLLSRAIGRARAARRTGNGGQTVLIMREMLGAALNRTHRRFKVVIGVLLVMLLTGTVYGFWRIQNFKREKANIDTRIANVEGLLQRAGLTENEADELADQLEKYEDQGRAIQASLLYRASVRQPIDPVEHDLAALMEEFGAETYKIPSDFLEQVKRFIRHIQGPDRPHMVAALNQSKGEVAIMRQLLQDAHLPPDFAYMAVVESAVSNAHTSSAGAAGVWQFTPTTAAAYGLRIGEGYDERLDVRKSTQAACKLLRDLILDFGAGSSVMLALAAYNSGSAKVKQGIRKVSDPIKQRNFWYLYRVRALPIETREYVPRVIAAMIIARDPENFGF